MFIHLFILDSTSFRIDEERDCEHVRIKTSSIDWFIHSSFIHMFISDSSSFRIDVIINEGVRGLEWRIFIHSFIIHSFIIHSSFIHSFINHSFIHSLVNFRFFLVSHRRDNERGCERVGMATFWLFGWRSSVRIQTQTRRQQNRNYSQEEKESSLDFLWNAWWVVWVLHIQ